MCDHDRLIVLPSCTVIPPLIDPAHGVTGITVTVIVWVSLAVPPLVQVTAMLTVPLPALSPRIVTLDPVALPLIEMAALLSDHE